MQDIDTGFIVGYGGWSSIGFPEPGSAYENRSNQILISDSHTLQVTSASITRQLSVPSVNSYYLPQNDERVKSPIRLGYGVYSYGGNISFELSNAAMFILTDDFMKRNAIFHLQMFDGHYTTTVYNCVWNNISISCNPNAICTISISFQSNNGYHDDLMMSDTDFRLGHSYDSTDFLIPYWQCGMEGIESFTLGFDRSVTPVYLNNDLKVPSYLRAGLVGVSLELSCLEAIENFDEDIEVRIGKDKKIVLRNKIMQSMSYNISTLGELGAKTYSWSSMSQNAENSIYSFG